MSRDIFPIRGRDFTCQKMDGVCISLSCLSGGGKTGGGGWVRTYGGCGCANVRGEEEGVKLFRVMVVLWDIGWERYADGGGKGTLARTQAPRIYPGCRSYSCRT